MTLRLDRKTVRGQQQAVDEMSGRGSFWKPGEGQHFFRLIPGWKGGPGVYFVGVATHYKIGATGGRVVCTEMTPGLLLKDRSCLVCRYFIKLKTSESPEDQEMAENIKPSLRFYMNVYVIPTKDDEGGLKVYPAPKSVYQDIKAILNMDEKEGNTLGSIIDMETGRNFCLDRQGMGRNDTSYKVLLGSKFGPVGNAKLIEDIENNAVDLNKYLQLTPPDEIRHMLGPVEGREETIAAEDEGVEVAAEDEGVEVAEDEGVEAVVDELEESVESVEEPIEEPESEPEPPPVRKPTLVVRTKPATAKPLTVKEKLAIIAAKKK